MGDTRCLPWTRSALCGSKAQLMQFALGKLQYISQILPFFLFHRYLYGFFSLWIEGGEVRKTRSIPAQFRALHHDGSAYCEDTPQLANPPDPLVRMKKNMLCLDVLVSPTMLSGRSLWSGAGHLWKIHGEPCSIFSPSFSSRYLLTFLRLWGVGISPSTTTIESPFRRQFSPRARSGRSAEESCVGCPAWLLF